MSTPDELDTAGPCLETRATRHASRISQMLRAIQTGLELPSDPAGGAPEIEVRPILGDAELEAVYRITHDAYVERNYCPRQPGGRLVHYPHLDRIPETTVLVALADGQIAGTNSWTLDGPNGLPEDLDFKTECDAIRREGRRLAAAWRLATRNTWRCERKVVMALIQETVSGLFEAGVQTSLFAFHKRHEHIYRRLLNMRTVARTEKIQGINISNASAVLMRLDREAVPERWMRNYCFISTPPTPPLQGGRKSA